MSNNWLHRHLWAHKCHVNTLAKDQDKASWIPGKLSLTTANPAKPTVDSKNPSVNPGKADMPTLVISLTSTSNLGTGYGFRNYYHITTLARLKLDRNLEFICLDTGCGITLIDQEFLRKHSSADLAVRTMGLSVSVQGIETTLTSEYIIISLFLLGISLNRPAVAKLT